MKKRVFSLLLALVMALSLVPAALAAEAVEPTPPEWIKAEEYVVFENGKIYEPAYWESLLHCRDFESSGETKVPSDSPLRTDFNKIIRISNPETDPAAVYEYGLLRLMNHKNNGYPSEMEKNNFSNILSECGKSLDKETIAKLELWSTRYTFQHDYYGKSEDKVVKSWFPDEVPNFVAKISDVMAKNGMDSVEEFLDCGTMNVVLGMETYQWMAAYAGVTPDADGHISIWLDREKVSLDVAPEVKNERTMVPIRAVAEALGADVEWVQDTQQIVMTRAGVTVTMTLNSTTATIDGESVEMDVAPYATEGRTLIPARYVAEFFGQRVSWDGEMRRVLITEDKSVAGDSNLEAWALAMGAIRSWIDRDHPEIFGQMYRSSSSTKEIRERLASAWGSGSNREGLIALIQRMTPHGHNDSFQEAAAIANSLTEAEMNDLISISSETDKYMWPYTKALSEKWGEKGILAWDLSRMANLVQWGYTAGFLTYEEALALIEPAAQMTAETFCSWEEFYENYLDGYNWWARNNVLEKDVWTVFRGSRCRSMLDSYTMKDTLDDTLFETGVIGLPEAE